jgi:hypothetical protein
MLCFLSFLLLQQSLFKISPLADTMLILKEMKYRVIDCVINDTFSKISSLYGFPQQKPSVLHCTENSHTIKNNLCLSQLAYETGMLSFR